MPKTKQRTISNTIAIKRPDLVEQWHPSKNGDLHPSKLTCGSGQKVWWRCEKGHEWESAIYSRTGNNKSGCPYCSGKRTTEQRNLEKTFPKLIEEWDYDKNAPLLPEIVSPFSSKKIWWKCEKGHEWEATIANRAGKNKNGCPYCAGKMASEHHNLAQTFPELLQDWCYDKNFPLTPETVTPFSHKKVWWKCSSGHEWFISISSRTKKKSGCPYCSGRTIGVDNSLAVLHPNLAREWDTEKNGNLTPYDVGPGTDKSIWWICNKSHSWQAPVCRRTNKLTPSGCPYCSGRNASIENNLAALFPNLLAEWDYEKNNPLRPENLTPGSNIKVWWKCLNGHEWRTSPNKRTGEGNNCPNCAPQSSRLEIRLFCELKHLFGNEVIWRYKIDKIEVDLYLKKYSIGVELDGYPWHLNKEEKDIAKKGELLKRGIILFRLRDSKLPRIDDSDIFYGSVEIDWLIIERLMVNLLQNVSFDTADTEHLNCYIQSGQIQNNDEYKRILSYLPSPPPEYSLANVHKHLANEWNYEKNAPLTPENFTPSARAKVWWKCPQGHEYQSYIYNRKKGDGCPFCAGKRVSKDNSLQSLFPEIAAQWQLEKNFPLTPDQVVTASNIKIWWRCKFGHEWQSKISDRTRKSNGCPYCSNKRINNDNSLQALHPEVAKQWHPSKNGDLSSEAISPGSSKRVWWMCNNGHEWESAIYSRTGKNKSGCPYCAGKKSKT